MGRGLRVEPGSYQGPKQDIQGKEHNGIGHCVWCIGGRVRLYTMI